MTKTRRKQPKLTARTKPSAFNAYWRLMRFDKPVGTFLVLWPTLWALWMAAGGVPNTRVLAIFVLGVIAMRAAGCVINDIADRKLDGKVRRTHKRPLVTGEIAAGSAVMLFIGLVMFAFVLVLLTNPLTLYLSFGALALAALYPYAKRHTNLPQVVLGAAFASSVPMAFAAQTGELDQGVWLIYTAVVLWTIAYDTFYAMVDREDDIKAGIRSTAILFAEMDRPITAGLQLMTLIALWLAGTHFELGYWYQGGLGVMALLFCWQQWLIRKRLRANCFRAFVNNQWAGAAVFAGLLLDYGLRS